MTEEAKKTKRQRKPTIYRVQVIVRLNEEQTYWGDTAITGTGTAACLKALKETGAEGRYRIIAVKAEVQLTVETVKKAKLE